MNNIKSNIIPIFFDKLEESNISYVVLRGFENLPNGYTNDIDFGVVKNDLDRFISLLKQVGEAYSYDLKISDLRLDVLKFCLTSEYDEILIDVWSTFNYVGLYYIDHEDIISNYKYFNKIKILKPENELALSYLKELLHMNRIRKDKVEGLLDKLDSSCSSTLDQYFSPSLVKEFLLSIRNKKFNLENLARRTRIALLKQNVSSRGFWVTFAAVFKFVENRINKRKLIKMKEKSFKIID